MSYSSAFMMIESRRMRKVSQSNNNIETNYMGTPYILGRYFMLSFFIFLPSNLSLILTKEGYAPIFDTPNITHYISQHINLYSHIQALNKIRGSPVHDKYESILL